jgi:hypothetical protein
VAVSSIRHDASDRITSVQLSGDVNPGNSGGPVLDAEGQAVGVAQSKVSGSSTAFAIPAEELARFLAGRVQAPSFEAAFRSSTRARFKVTTRLIDPLGNIQRVRVAWCLEDSLRNPLKPDKEGKWRQMNATAITMGDLSIEKGLARGELSAKRGEAEPDQSMLFVQLYYERTGGEGTWTEPTPLEVRFKPDVDRTARRQQEPPARPTEEARTTPTEEEPARPGDDDALEPKEQADGPAVVEIPPSKGEILPVADHIRIQQKLLLRAALAELILSPAGDALYVLDLSEGMVYSVDPDTLEIRARRAAADNAMAMCLTPDGTRLYVGGHDPVLTNRSGRGRVRSGLRGPWDRRLGWWLGRRV